MKILPILAPNLEKRDDRRRAVKLSIMAKVRMEKLWGMYKFIREKNAKKSKINLAFTAINSIFAKKNRKHCKKQIVFQIVKLQFLLLWKKN